MVAELMASDRWIPVPAGTFEFGGRDNDKFVGASERPRREVNIATGFELGFAPVTEAEFARFRPGGPESDLPVVNVSARDAAAYCNWLSDQTGYGHRLPSEVEWEYAARAGSDTIFQQGDTLRPEEACFYYNEQGDRVGPGRRVPVGSYAANAFGLADMLGNVAEWTASAWTATLDAAAVPDDSLRVIRGGAWDYLPRLLRVSWRDALSPITRRDNLGFRVLREGGGEG